LTCELVWVRRVIRGLYRLSAALVVAGLWSALATQVTALCSILGLRADAPARLALSRSSLRYGRVLVMTDQDDDGAHIKGLIINMFHTLWPQVLAPRLPRSGGPGPWTD
jgi:hypothetical protein